MGKNIAERTDTVYRPACRRDADQLSCRKMSSSSMTLTAAGSPPTRTCGSVLKTEDVSDLRCLRKLGSTRRVLGKATFLRKFRKSDTGPRFTASIVSSQW
jgi:hypothetical protein